MKNIGLTVAAALLTLATTGASAQTVQQNKQKTTTTTPSRNGTIVIDGQRVNQKPGVPQQRPGSAAHAGQEYSTSPRDGVNSYPDQVNNDHQGATAENGQETVTILPKDAATVVPAKTTKKPPVTNTSAKTKIKP